jgi:hypothetical protein
MIKTCETLLERRVRHQKEFLEGLRGLPEASARIQTNFYFRSGGLWELDLASGKWDQSDRNFAGIPESFAKERLL